MKNEMQMVSTDKEQGEMSPVRASQEPTEPPKVVEVDGQYTMNISEGQAVDTYGASDLDMVNALQNQTLQLLGKDTAKANGSLAMLHGIRPRDALEGMLATQMVAVHNMTMEMSKRAMLKNQTFEGLQECGKQATKLARTFAAQMEALQKYRTKGQQTIQVQHVQVNDGGQAIIGDVKAGEGGNG